MAGSRKRKVVRKQITHREIASEIARDLFEVKQGTAKHLRLYTEFELHGRYLGGYSREAVASLIAWHLENAYAQRDAAARRGRK